MSDLSLKSSSLGGLMFSQVIAGRSFAYIDHVYYQKRPHDINLGCISQRISL